ncbi:MAG: hypothetical protein P1T08_11320 [Acidimicrobiia bacterium]|nr:hypothetical protein [Acidimicrobiia bacterium]
MHEHNFDLIAAFADGTASREEAVEAERAVGSCSECAAEHEAQLAVLEVLRAAPAVSMTDIERGALHRSLAEALPARPVGWFSRYAPRIAAVAAGFAVVGLASVAMLGQLTGNDTADDDYATSAELSSARSQIGDAEAPSPVAEEMLSQADAPGTSDDALQYSAEGAGGDGTAPDTATTTAAGAPAEVVELTGADLEDLADLAVTKEILEQFAVVSEMVKTSCPEQLPDQPQLELAAEVVFEGEPAFVVVYTTAAERVALALSLQDCSVLGEFVSTP